MHARPAEVSAHCLDVDPERCGDLLLGGAIAVGDDDLQLREKPLCVGGICRLFRTRGRGEPLGSPWRRRLRDCWRRMQWLACSARPGPLACPFKCLHESERSRSLGRTWTVHSGSIYSERLPGRTMTTAHESRLHLRAMTAISREPRTSRSTQRTHSRRGNPCRRR